MSRANKKTKIKLPRATVAQCRDRAKLEDISVSKLVKRAIAQYLATPTSGVPTKLSAPGISTADYARLVTRVEQLEVQLAQMRIAPVTTLPLAATRSSAAPVPDDEDLEDVDEPDEILYEFLDASRSSV